MEFNSGFKGLNAQLSIT